MSYLGHALTSSKFFRFHLHFYLIYFLGATDVHVEIDCEAWVFHLGLVHFIVVLPCKGREGEVGMMHY